MHQGFWADIPRPIIGLAPMDGVTDAPMRFMAAKYGKPHVMMTEFTTVEGITRGALKPLIAFLYNDIERPIVAQVFGTDPEAFYKTTFIVAELGFDGIDINMGCPAGNVAGKGAGAGLIRTPDLAKQIIRRVKQAARDYAEGRAIEEVGLPENIVEYVKNWKAISAQRAKDQSASPPPKPSEKIAHQNTRIHLPVSVKTRIGYDTITVEEWVKHLLEEEPVNITLHGRTLKQMYTGSADWDAIARGAKIIHEAPTTVLGNGDIKSLDEGMEKVKQYGVDGFMIGRASFGNPGIFGQSIKHTHSPTANLTQKSTLPSPLELAQEHARLYEELISHDYFIPMRKHLAWYCRGFPGASDIRQKLMHATSADDVKAVLEQVPPPIETNENHPKESHLT